MNGFDALPELMTMDQLAERLGVTHRHVRRLVDERRVPFLRVGRFIRFDPTEIADWLNRSRVPGYADRIDHCCLGQAVPRQWCSPARLAGRPFFPQSLAAPRSAADGGEQLGSIRRPSNSNQLETRGLGVLRRLDDERRAPVLRVECQSRRRDGR